MQQFAASADDRSVADHRIDHYRAGADTRAPSDDRAVNSGARPDDGVVEDH